MQTTIPINFTSEIVDCGFIGEHNAVELDVTVPSDMLSDEHIFRLAFEIGELSARSGVLTATDGIVSYDVPLSVTSTQTVNMQLEEYASDESFIKKSALVILRFANSVPNGTAGIDDDAGMVAEVTANTAARHTHTNKAVIDAIETAPPQIYTKYYANDGVNGRVLLDSATLTTFFGAVDDFLPSTAKIIDISVRYTNGTITSDVPIFGGYYYMGVNYTLLTSVDSFLYGNQSETIILNGATIRPYLRVATSRATTAGAIYRSGGSNTYILGFTVTYIE